jgi:exopolysaccharide production protein ExoZ
MFIWVQVLRGIAAAIVVCHHFVASQADKVGNVNPWLINFGGSGTDIFFVISGFIMMITQSDSAKDLSAKHFLVRRLVRIVPLYWILTAVAFALASVASASVNTHVSLQKFVMSMLFLPYSETDLVMTSSGFKAYVIPMAWTLTYEWYFYLVFALTLALGLKSFARLQFIAAWFVCCAVIGFVFQPSSLLLQVLTSPLVFEFLLGCAVAMLYMNGARLNGFQSALLAVAAMVVLANIFHHSAISRTLLWGFASFALVAAAALYEGGKKHMALIRPLSWLGDISYSLYLSHFFTLALFVRLQTHLAPLQEGFGILAMFVFVLLNLVVSELCYRFIEEPARVFFAQRRKPVAVKS